ncbi:MAG TPA: ligase-associated DNA damage response endonuclease PdeM, partial [Alphaproteobacteria bacterium]|nr:ligase-associated DNA damage response endonuclease PdeM [Alphaproteobacteria bacterium]
MSSAFAFAGTELVADPSGALYWPDEETLIVSDLHFEKGSAYARRGIFLPPYDTRATLKSLASATERYKPKQMIALGDSFHDAWGSERIAPRDKAMLGELMMGREWIWVLGNHDPAPPKELGGDSCDEFRLGQLTFRHEPQPGAAIGEVAGHLHPCATVGTRL